MRLRNDCVHLTQKTFVFNEQNKFLTLFRTETAPTRPLTWDLPGGTFEIGETPQEGARREISEETGITVKDLAPIAVEGSLNPDKEYWVTIAYRATAESSDITLSFEHCEYRWVTVEEFLLLPASEKWHRIARNLVA